MPVVVTVRLRSDLWTLRAEYEDGAVFGAKSDVDVEELMVDLRGQLDEAGRRLNCNRYRENALISGMSRGMSDGLACYLVKAWIPMLNWRLLHGSLDPAPAHHVVSSQQAQRYIDRWRRRGVWLLPIGLAALVFWRSLDLLLQIRHPWPPPRRNRD